MVVPEGEQKVSPQSMIGPSLATAGKYFIRQRIDAWGPAFRPFGAKLLFGFW